MGISIRKAGRASLAALIAFAAAQLQSLAATGAAPPGGSSLRPHAGHLSLVVRLTKPPSTVVSKAFDIPPFMPARQSPTSPNGPPRRAPLTLPHAAGSAQATGAGPAVLASFPGASYLTEKSILGHSWEPPDTQVAAGQNYLVELTNISLSIWNKDGSLVSMSDPGTFFGVSAGFGFADPRALYDPLSGRWFLGGFSLNGDGTQSRSYLAVSTSSDPRGGWVVYSTRLFNYLADQPKMATTRDKVVVSWDDYGCRYCSAFLGEETWVVQKSDALAGASAPAASWFGPDASKQGLVPSIELTPADAAYLVYNGYRSSPAGWYLGVVTITGTPAAADVQWSDVHLPIQPTFLPPPSRQPGSVGALAPNSDNRLLSAVWSNGILWTTAQDDCRLVRDSTDRSCLRLLQLQYPASPTVLIDADVGVIGDDLSFPALMTDSSGNLFVTATESSVTTFAEAVAMWWPAGAPAPSPPVVLQPGAGTYDFGPCGYTNRWGDYSGAAQDPADPRDVWLAAEYMPSPTNSCAWSTGIARVTPHPTVAAVSPNSGPTSGGTSVVVGGSGFSHASAVQFGANAGTNLVVTSDRQLTVTSPAGSGMVDITVSSPGATSWVSSADQFWYGGTYSALGTKQYWLSDSDGITWKDITGPWGIGITLTVSPPVDSFAILSASADLWTTKPGYNQDIGIYIQEANSTQYPAGIVAWKESGGFAGTYSPNAAFVHTVFLMSAGTTYHLKLQWKTNRSVGLDGGPIAAGAGTQEPYSPTSLTARLIPVNASGSGRVVTQASTQQYLLQNNDGAAWQDIDAQQLGVTVTPTSNAVAIISGNADLWTTQAGFNQDIGIYLREADGTQYPGKILAWKESGGFAGTYSPNAAFVETVYSLSANTTYHFTLQWKANRDTRSNGQETIVAGAGGSPSGMYSPTRLTVQLLVAGTNAPSVASTQQYLLTGGTGTTWNDIDATNLSLMVTPTTNCLAVISANADLWTTQAGFNQDIGIAIQEANPLLYPGNVVAWKESGGFAGTYSPNAAYVQTMFSMTGGVTYHVGLRWKTNKDATGSGDYIAAGAGPIGSAYSPSRLTVQFASCS